MRKNAVIIIILSLIITSCKDKIPEGFYIEKKFDNGNIQILSKSLKDTILNKTSHKLRFSRNLDINGAIVREGKYIGKERVGEHFVYENNTLKYIKSYEFFSDIDIDFIKNTKIFENPSKFNNKISYINSKISLANNERDTLLESSTFVDIKIEENKIKLGDSLKADFTYYDCESQTDLFMLYIVFPENPDYIDIIHYPGSRYLYRIKTEKKGKKVLSGFAIIGVFDIDNNNDTTWGHKVYKLNKEYTVY